MTSTWHANLQMLRDYASGSLSDAIAWSVEAHLPACADCRSRLIGVLSERDRTELAKLREGLSVPVRVAQRPVTRSTVLRGVLGPWWVWLGLVVAAFGAVTVLGLVPTPGSGLLRSWAVAVAPLVPLSMVAVVYALADRDSAASVTPRGGLELVLIRTAAVLAIAIPTVTVGMVAAGVGTVAWLLPGLALCAGALALGPEVGVERACVGLAVLWGVVVLAAAPPVELTSAATLIDPAGAMQALWGIALVAAVGVVAARRDRFDTPGSVW